MAALNFRQGEVSPTRDEMQSILKQFKTRFGFEADQLVVPEWAAKNMMVWCCPDRRPDQTPYELLEAKKVFNCAVDIDPTVAKLVVVGKDPSQHVARLGRGVVLGLALWLGYSGLTGCDPTKSKMAYETVPSGSHLGVNKPTTKEP